MIKETIQDAINRQINRELYSAYLYTAMSAYFETLTLRGASKYMRVQANEERAHAMKFFDYIVERGGTVKLTAIDAPPVKWESPLKVFEEAYKHEQKVTGWINDLVNLAIKEQDHATNNMLQWFVREQVEEEANAAEIVEKIKMLGPEGHAFLWLDHELGKRE